MMENMGSTPSLSKLEEDLEYHFQDQKLLLHALTHPSYSNEMGHPKEASNQRLEFLGDAVLELALAVVAKSLQLSSYLLLGKGEEREGIQFRDSVLSDALEAVIGAIYLDGGMEKAEGFVRGKVLSDIEHKTLFQDAKTMLQEYCTAKRYPLEYDLLEESGPFHQRFYKVSVKVNEEVYGIGEGSSKKKAEQAAAYFALEKIKVETGDVFKVY